MLSVALLFASVVCTGFGQYNYNATWESINSRPLPTWYDEGKFGIFVVWGVYSVPSFGSLASGEITESERFWYNWQSNMTDYVNFMDKNYRPGFSYEDFAPSFSAEFWDPVAWAKLFQSSGARYVVFTTKHHDGFTLWPSNTSWNWNSVNNGPHRDLTGELTAAVKQQGLAMGLYHSMFEWYNPNWLNDQANQFKSDIFVQEKTLPELYDIVNAYQPDIIWSDGDWEAPSSYWQSTEFLAWLYNESPVRDTVVVNDRWGEGCPCQNGGFYTCQDRYNPGHL